MPRALFAFPIVLAILTIAPAATANTDSDHVEIHGYGGWAYGRSNADDNRYLASSKAGEADYVNMAVAFTSRSSDRVWINAQVWWEQSQGEEWTSVVDFAFGEWRVSDALRFRVGQVKHPFGIYTEVFDVGTLRPFFWLPQSVYGPSGVVAEAYRGAGLTGSVFTAGDWRLEYDFYGGELNLEAPPFASLLASAMETAGDEDSAELEEEVEVRDLVGSRVTVTVPGSEVRMGISAYTGREEGGNGERHSSLGAHAEYLTDDWSCRSEYTFLRESQTVDATNAYIELARRLGNSWQIAGRADYSKTTLDGIDAGEASPLLDHLDLATGLNYWFHTDFVLKLSTSWVDGNRFARPEDLRAAIEDEGLNRKTRLVSLGVQFAF